MARSSRHNSPAIKHLNRLRSQILQLAVQGKLVPQDPTDEPASVLLKRIATKREQLVKTKKLKKPKPLPPIQPDEIPYGIPKGWEWARLGDIAIYDAGNKVQPGQVSKSTWLLELEDIGPSTGKLLQRVLARERNPSSTKTTFENKDVLYSKLRPYLQKVLVADQAGYATTEIVSIRRLSEALEPLYLSHFLRSQIWNQYVSNLTKGSRMPRLGKSEATLGLIPLPPLTEQQRIVTKVDQLMTAIDELEAHLYRLETLRPKLLQLAVQGKLVPQDPTDEPASVLFKRIATKREQLVKTKKLKKPKPLPPIQPDEIPYEIPEGWEWARLGELSLVVGGGTPKTSTLGMFTNGGLGHGWLTPADLSDYSKRYITHGARDLTDAGLASCSAVLLPTGSVVISSRAPIGYVAITSQPLSTNQGFRSLVLPITGLAEYLHIVVQAFQPRLEALGSGTTFKEISGVKLATFETPIPPLAEQQRIVTKVDQLIAAIDTITDPVTLVSEPHMSS